MMLTKIVVQPAPLRNQVAEQLREAMMSGLLPPGQRLNERELCEQMGVSRTSIREALRSLESQGLVTSVPHRGVVVALLSRKETVDNYATRGALEGLLVRQFVRNADLQKVARLRQVVEQLDRQNRQFNILSYVRLKTDFYEVLMDGADNAVAAGVLRLIHARVAQLWATSLSRNGRAEQSVVEISRLVDAVEARDEQRAFDLCMAHNASALHNTLEIIDNGIGSLDSEPSAGRSVRRKAARAIS